MSSLVEDFSGINKRLEELKSPRPEKSKGYVIYKNISDVPAGVVAYYGTFGYVVFDSPRNSYSGPPTPRGKALKRKYCPGLSCREDEMGCSYCLKQEE
jgi:hypothetical protein